MTTNAIIENPEGPEGMEAKKSLVPTKTPGYVPFGQFEDLMSVVKSELFYPTFITGLSGNGKSLMVREVCARANKPYVRLNVTAETDEDDLLGGFRLEVENGASKTTFKYGPVVTAMRLGAILLLDEVDCGTPKLMCLQPILEGEPVYLKKMNQIIHPAKGFNIIACANTKGQGDEAGKFVGTNMLNEAFLERFAITIEQDYPGENDERKILAKQMEFNFGSGKVTTDDEEFVNNLIKWASAVRKTYKEGGIDDVITTRRLVLICKSYAIFRRDRKKAIEMAVSRFNKDTKESFLEFYGATDPNFRGRGGAKASAHVGRPQNQSPF